MNQHRKIVTCLIIISFFIVTLTACSNVSSQPQTSSTGSYFIFDTFVTVKVYSDDIQDQHYEEIGDILKGIDQTMNRQLAGSELDQVNKQAGLGAVKVSPDTFMVVQKALEYANLSEGRFEPTIGPVVDLWGIGSNHAQIPEESILAQTIQLVNHNDVVIDSEHQSVMLTKPGMSLDLGAIAKGYAADQIATYLRAKGFNSAMIDLGGNVLAMGTKPNKDLWTIGIQDPESTRGETIGTIKVNNKTIVSSGIYERFFIEDGVRYHHILDPSTGYPVTNNLLSVTIVTTTSMDADALSTSVFSLGLEKGLALVESLEDVEAFFITNERIIYTSTGFADQLHITNSRYSQYKE